MSGSASVWLKASAQRAMTLLLPIESIVCMYCVVRNFNLTQISGAMNGGTVDTWAIMGSTHWTSHIPSCTCMLHMRKLISLSIGWVRNKMVKAWPYKILPFHSSSYFIFYWFYHRLLPWSTTSFAVAQKLKIDFWWQIYLIWYWDCNEGIARLFIPI
jgi:hypothetical protein